MKIKQANTQKLFSPEVHEGQYADIY